MLTHDDGSSAGGGGTDQVDRALCCTCKLLLLLADPVLHTSEVGLGAAWWQADVDLSCLTSGAHLGWRGVGDGREGSNDDGGELHFCDWLFGV